MLLRRRGQGLATKDAKSGHNGALLHVYIDVMSVGMYDDMLEKYKCILSSNQDIHILCLAKRFLKPNVKTVCSLARLALKL